MYTGKIIFSQIMDFLPMYELRMYCYTNKIEDIPSFLAT